MTLKQALKVTCDSKYEIIARKCDGNYVYVTLDYTHGDQKAFADSLKRCRELENAKNKVKFISYNQASHALSITIDLI